MSTMAAASATASASATVSTQVDVQQSSSSSITIKPKYHGVTANEFFVERINQLTREADLRTTRNDPVEEPTDDDYPCIDISSWIIDEPSAVNEEERAKVVRQVAQQAREAGSFNIRGHGIDDELLDRLEMRSKEFFRLSLDEKLHYSNSDSASARGYKPIQSESAAAVYGRANQTETESKDLRETYTMVYPLQRNNINAPQLFQEVLNEYIQHMDRLDHILHEILTAALAYTKGITLPPNLLESAKGLSSKDGLLRVSSYAAMPQPPEYKNATKLQPHSDWGPLTILYSEYPGLEEIRNGRWIPVPVHERKGELHVFIGETIAATSNLCFQNNIHRVSHDATPDRTSYAYFSGQGFAVDGAVDADADDGIEAICAPGEQPMFGKISPSSHLKEYLKRYFTTSPE